MPNWTASMQRTYEYYTVDPGTWKDVKRIDHVKTCTISRDSSAETKGSASFDLGESIGECYIRTYLVTIQNGVKERHPLGTHLVQTPYSGFNGRVSKVTVDAYTPLLELKEKPMPLGFAVLKGENIMKTAYRLVRERVRAPVVSTDATNTLYQDFVANTDDTGLTFTSDLVANADYTIDLDEMGRIIFPPKQDIASLQPVWTYTDDNSSILYPDISLDHDLYGIPNVVEVIYSNGNTVYETRAVNDDPNSPTSTVSRGREIPYRVTDPDLAGWPTEKEIDRYAEQLLKDLSSIEYTISYTHGYCPVRVGDCVRIDSKRAGITNVKAKVISQSIKCDPSCPVTEKAVYTKKLWR